MISTLFSKAMKKTLEKIVEENFLNQSTKQYFCEKQIQFKLGIELSKKLKIEPEFEKAICHVLAFKKRQYIDLFFEYRKKKIGIEIKYKTTNNTANAKSFEHHGAQTNGRAQCMFDVYRLEQFMKCKAISIGYFIFITNDKSYWTNTQKNNCQYTLEHKSKKTGVFKANWKSCPEYCNNFKLEGIYDISWIIKSEFGCLIIPIK